MSDPEHSKNVPHKFDLTGAKKGDWFIGCPKCWRQYPLNAAAKPVCDHCGGTMLMWSVTQQDVEETEK